jgi:hypothetical protein
MSSEPSPRAEQIQANVAAALSRLRGEPATGAPPSASSSKQAAANPQPDQILTEAEPLFSVDADPLPSGIGVPDPNMALGARGGYAAVEGQPATPFERMTGLKPGAGSQNPNLAPDEQPDLLQGIGVSPPPLADLPDADSEEVRRRRRRRNRLMLGAAAIGLLGGFWILTGGDSPEGEVPVITADGAPDRVKPEEEGGLSVPNQDVAILNEGTATEGETVLPAPEQPAPPPVVVEAPAEPAPATVATAPEASAPQATTPETTTPETTTPEASATAPVAGAPAIPSVSAPDVADIPSVPAPTELGTAPAPAEAPAEATQQSAESTASTEPASSVTEPAASDLPTITAAIQPVPGGTARIQLASVKSEDGARQEWSRLQKAHPAILGGLQLFVEKFEKSPGDIYFRVQAGPLGDKASAKQICADLKKKNQACIVAN